MNYSMPKELIVRKYLSDPTFNNLVKMLSNMINDEMLTGADCIDAAYYAWQISEDRKYFYKIKNK